MNIKGNKYSHWTIIEDKDERKKGILVVDVQCECGTIRKTRKNVFVYGHYPLQCSRCSLKEQKKKRFCLLPVKK